MESLFGGCSDDSGYYDGVVLIHEVSDGLAMGHMLPSLVPVVVSGAALTPGKHTLYDFSFTLDDGICFLGSQSTSWSIETTAAADLSPQILELCAGLGGMGIGSVFLGGSPKVSVDKCRLSVEHLRANTHGHVLQLDICDPASAKVIHQSFGGTPGTTTMGFPCQPFSSQGLMLGAKDPRMRVFWAGLRIAYLLQSQTVIFECVPAAGQQPEVQAGLRAFADAMEYDILEIYLDLADRWPCRRARWWALLLPKAWNVYGMQPWTPCTSYQCCGDVFGDWGAWSEPDEDDLQLFGFELEAYCNPAFGDDHRVLNLHHYATKDYVAALCSQRCTAIPATCTLVKSRSCKECPMQSTSFMDPESHWHFWALVASPMQMVWIYGHLRYNVAKALDQAPLPHPDEWLKAYQEELLRQTSTLFAASMDDIPQMLEIHDGSGDRLFVISPTAITVSQLPNAQRISLAWNEAGGISRDGRPLALDTLMDRHTGPYHLTSDVGLQERPRPSGIFMIGIAHQGQLLIEFLTGGQFLFQALRPHGLDHINFLLDGVGKVYGADFRVWKSLRLTTLDPQLWPPRYPTLRANGLGSLALGLHDAIIWEVLLQLAQMLPDDQRPLLLHPQLAACLLRDDPLPTGLDLYDKWTMDGQILCIFEAQGHWLLLRGLFVDGGLHWTLSDGMYQDIPPEARRLAAKLSGLLEVDRWDLQLCSIYQQHANHTCGTIALLHACIFLGFYGLFDEPGILGLHQWLLLRSWTYEPAWCLRIYGMGPSPELQAQLAALLATKGVPSHKAADRAAAALTKLGISPVQQALRQSNPWQSLKGLTTKPGANFQFVLKEELQEFIQQKAKTKHGASISMNKKEKKPNRRSPPPTWQLDPLLLTIDPKHFVDGDGDCLPQISLDQVIADGRGLAICTVTQAAPYLRETKNISTDALGLLLTEEVPPEARGSANITSLRFPATFKPTQDPLLISGSLLQLGDSEITRFMATDPADEMDVVATQVLKVQIYRDEVGADWSQVAASPIKFLLHKVPLLKLCTALHCKHDCGNFHASVEEPLDQVLHEIWGRRYQSIEGKSLPAHQAELFMAFLRVAKAAMTQLVPTLADGIYFEPRNDGSRGTDEGYAVVWIPGANREVAVHKLKLSAHGLSLARMKHRFGLRVHSTYEETTHQELRPGIDFHKVQVTHIYRVHPLPHGLQRAVIAKLLRDWKWDARPLQPSRGTSEGGAWDVGSASPPPCNIMTAYSADVLITLMKDKTVTEKAAPVLGPRRVQKQMQRSAPASSSHGGDPWLDGKDPWSGWQGPQAAAAPQAPSKRLDALTDQLKSEVQVAVTKEINTTAAGIPPQAEQRIQRLETGLQELQVQGQKFHHWFEETGTRLAGQDQALTQVQQQLAQTQKDLVGVHHEVQQSSDNLTHAMQASLQSVKKEITEEMGATLSAQMDRFEQLLRPGFSISQFLLKFLFLFGWLGTAQSFQLPLARHLEHRTADRWSDRHYGSGDTGQTGCLAASVVHPGHQIFSIELYLHWGEATNPGPPDDDIVHFGFSNPGGLRNKEEIAMAFGTGVWHYSETQLSSFTQKSFTARMKQLAIAENRQLRLHLGAPVATRTGSEWAGTWSGVGCVSDYPSQEVQLPYGPERQTGRVLTTCHYIRDVPILTSVVCGYPSGPTWPKSKELTAQLLEPLSHHIVLGGHGPRMIGGDFNMGQHDLACFELWRSLGWKSAQTLAWELWQQPLTMTCKHVTERDFIWLSPEAIALCRFVDVSDHFADHATVTVGIQIPSTTSTTLMHWPLPSQIPWQDLPDGWDNDIPCPQWTVTAEVDTQWSELGQTLESCLDRKLPQQPGSSLQASQRGRLQSTKPRRLHSRRTMVKPSRPSEVALRCDLIGSATKHWFRQLRRLQSYVAAINANKLTDDAITYRLELWSSIRRAPGFDKGFVHWWSYGRTAGLPEAPLQFPQGPPGQAVAETIFTSFKMCFEKFEAWNLRQRNQLLRVKYEAGMKGIFRDLRKTPRDQLDLLQDSFSYVVLAADASEHLVQLDKPIVTTGHSKWTWDDEPITVEIVAENIISTTAATALDHGHMLCQHRVISQVPDIHEALSSFWTATWNAWEEVDENTWDRITNFIQAYVPQIGMALEPISMADWRRTLRRFQAKAAPGLHGVAGSTLGEGHIDKLRTLALRNLRLNSAGTNGRLRLFLSTTPSADPGLWRLLNTVFTFQRMLRKDDLLLSTWTLFMKHYDGRLFSGPFSQLITVLNQVNWRVDPPNLIDHDGFSYDLYSSAKKTLTAALHDGWAQHVAQAVNHRHTMQDLQGIDFSLAQLDKHKLTALENSLVASLQAGSFIGNEIHSKYDVTKDRLCHLCHTPDGPGHWLDCPRFQPQRDAIPDWTDRTPLDTESLRTHLLPSRSPWATAWKTELLSLEKFAFEFLSRPCAGPQHLFCDGTAAGEEPFCFAAWGGINATTGETVALGHLGGLCQDSARAEITGAIACISWQLFFLVEVHLWVDSKHLADGIRWILVRGRAGVHWENFDLWQRLAQLLLELGDLPLHVHWQPSHLDPMQMEDPYEDFCCEWNSRIDRLVNFHNYDRSSTFWNIHAAASQHHAQMSKRIRQLRSFFTAVAALKPDTSTTPEGLEAVSFDFDEDHGTLHDFCTMDPTDLVFLSGWDHPRYPPEFMVGLLHWIFGQSTEDGVVYPMSFVELTIGFSSSVDAKFPFWNPHTHHFELSSLQMRYERPTLAQLLSIVRDSIKKLVAGLDRVDLLFSDCPKIGLLIHRPMDGIFLCLPQATVQACQEQTKAYFRSRPFRRSCDIARPI
eukprot:Skav214855  [mRNA]  locus=scaffold16:296995:306518:- [translate_table: standard]